MELLQYCVFITTVLCCAYNGGKKYQLYNHCPRKYTLYNILYYIKILLALPVLVTVFYCLLIATNAGKCVRKVREVSKGRNKYDIAPATIGTVVPIYAIRYSLSDVELINCHDYNNCHSYIIYTFGVEQQYCNKS